MLLNGICIVYLIDAQVQKFNHKNEFQSTQIQNILQNFSILN